MITVTVLPPPGVRVNAAPRAPANVSVSGSAVNLGGTNNYARLNNKPAINGHELHAGENSLSELNIGRAAFADIDTLFR